MGKESSGGIGFLGALTILFIALKLLGEIDWSWFWVVSPVILSAIISVAYGIIQEYF